MKLAGKVALVTGGGQGIGLGISRRLAAEGASVAIAQRTLETAEQAAAEIVAGGGTAVALQVDVSSAEQVRAMVEEVVSRCGRIDVLVNNAALTGHTGITYRHFLDVPLADWQRTLDVNLTGVFLCSQAAARHMARQSGGRIINVSSIDGQVPEYRCSHYVASKGGVEALTRAMALDLGEHNILVNAIAPGAIRSHPRPGTPEPTGSNTLLRAGRPEEIAGVAVLLASDDGSYLTGQVITVDGGYVVKPWRYPSAGKT